MNKKKIIISIGAIALLFFGAMRISGKKTAPTQEAIKQPTVVAIQSINESRTLAQKNQFPGTVVGDQEVKITAKSAGTIMVAPGNIGDAIGAGALLAKIDDNGTLGIGSEGLQSLQIQQSTLAVEQARKSYVLAKDTYDNIKKTSTSTRAQVDSARAQRDIAKLQYENAVLGLNGGMDNHLITSPISGVITSKSVSVGDSVSLGQQLATISKSNAVKVQFYVNSIERSKLLRGQKISALDENGNALTLIVRNIAASADPTTKRFLIEAYPEKQTASKLLAGTIITIVFETSAIPQSNANLILPLSVISVGQNENFIFVFENSVAKKYPVTIIKVTGENAEVSTNLPNDALIITEGNKLLKDGETISLQK
jgi:RND family efflux transporter MFP subunit